MAQVQFVNVNVYAINSNALSAPLAMAFNAANVKLRALDGTDTVLGVTLNAAIEEYPHGLQVNSTQYKVAQTVAQLVTSFNS